MHAIGLKKCKNLFRQLGLGENGLCLGKLLNQPSSVEGEGWKNGLDGSIWERVQALWTDSQKMC